MTHADIVFLVTCTYILPFLLKHFDPRVAYFLTIISADETLVTGADILCSLLPPLDEIFVVLMNFFRRVGQLLKRIHNSRSCLTI